MPTSTRRATSPVAAVMEYLLPRDRLLLQLLDAHRVLTTSQAAILLGFGSLRRCQDRLHRLHQLGLLERWRHRDGYGGSQPWRWTLGPVGTQLQAAANGQSQPSQRVIRDRLSALVTSPGLTRRIGLNQFFTDLVAHSRTGSGARLLRWCPERWAASLVRQAVVPDGHGLWHADDLTTAWFLEWDSDGEFSGGRRPRQPPRSRVDAAHELISKPYRLQQMWCKHLAGVSLVGRADPTDGSMKRSHDGCGSRRGVRADEHGTSRAVPGPLCEPSSFCLRLSLPRAQSRCCCGLGARVEGRVGVGVMARLETVIGTDPPIWPAPQHSPAVTGAARCPERPDGSSPGRGGGNA